MEITENYGNHVSIFVVGLRPYFLTVDTNRPRDRVVKASKNLDQRGLSRAISPGDKDKFTFVDRKVYRPHDKRRVVSPPCIMKTDLPQFEIFKSRAEQIGPLIM